MLMYPASLRFHASKITENGLSVAEFYPMHDEISDAKVIILSVDEHVAGSYTLAESYLGFLRRFVDLDYVVLYDTNTKLRLLSEASISGDSTAFAEAIARIRKAKLMSDQMLSLTEECYNQNLKLLPDSKFTMFGVRSITSVSGITADLTSDLFGRPAAFNAEMQKLVSESDSAAFCEKFRSLEAELSSILGDKYTKYLHYVELLETGTLAEVMTYETLISLVPTEGGVIFAVLPEDLCVKDSPFLKMVEEYYGKTVVNRTLYYGCETKADRKVVSRSDGRGAFLFGDDSVYIVPSVKTEKLRRRLSDVCGKIPDDDEIFDLIGDVGVSSVFVVSGFKCVTYGAGENAGTQDTDTQDTIEERENADT